MKQLVFVPVATNELGVLSGEPEMRDRKAFTVTPDLLDELEYTQDMTEDAEYAAMVLASVSGLIDHGVRLVVVADVDSNLVHPGEDSVNGECLLTHCPPSAITSWFCDAPGVELPQLRAGASIDEAWDTPEVQELLRDHDLLWNDIEEYRRGLQPA